MLPPSNNEAQVKALKMISSTKRTLEQAQLLAALEQQLAAERVEEFRQRANSIIEEELAEIVRHEPDYEADEKLLDDLQIDLTQEAGSGYISLHELQSLLVKTSGHRVVANTVYRRAKKYFEIWRSLVDRLERLWAHYSPADVEWKSQAMVADFMDPYRARAESAARHASYAEAAYWALQRTSVEIETLIRTYDMAADVGAPVGVPQQ